MNKAVNNIIDKSVIKVFYNEHLIILGIVYLVMFGAVQGDRLPEYHLKLIEGTVTSYAALSLVLSIWLIYFLRVQYFLGQLIENKQNHFLQQITLLPINILWSKLLKIVCVCLLPISSYSIAIILWSFNNHYFIKGVIISCFMLLIHLVGILFIHKKLRYNDFVIFRFSTPSFKYSISKIFPIQFYLNYLFSQQKLQWLVLKIITILTIQLSFHSSLPNEELRFPIFFYIMIFLIHTNLIKQFIIWENTQLWHMKLLPLHRVTKFLNYLGFILVLILPEMIQIFLAYPNHLTLFNSISIMMLSISSLMFIFSICIAFDNIYENFSPLILLLLLLIYIAALAECVLLFSTFTLIASFIIYFFSVSKFELSNNNDVDSYQ